VRKKLKNKAAMFVPRLVVVAQTGVYPASANPGKIDRVPHANLVMKSD
jgi:hypothetical protein